MSTKINVRSPFYLNLTEPTLVSPLYDCAAAYLTGFSIDNQGIITEPSLTYGTIYSYTSSDADFSNGKFAVETNDTLRTVDFTLTIPSYFSNSADLYYVCSPRYVQPGTSGTAAPCSGGSVTSGSIPSQTLNSGGATVDIDLSGYFTNETTYQVTNNNPLLITTALSGSTLTLTSNNQGGSATVYALARDASYPTTCEAVQPISITINATGVTWSCTVPTNPALQGGSITSAGVITNPQIAAVITGISLSNGGSLITSVSPNTGSTAQDVTLFFKITVPVGYDNAGATVWCEKILSQAGTTLPTFTCAIASLTGQQIAKNGAISLGTAVLGTVNSFTPPNPAFGTVTTNTVRNVEYQVEIPVGYLNAGTEINCTKEIIQPATTTSCSGAINSFFITAGKNAPLDFCDATYATSVQIKSSSTTTTGLMGTQICSSGNTFQGKNLYYGISPGSISSAAGVGVGDFYVVQISNSGIIIDVQIASCQGGGGGGSTIVL